MELALTARSSALQLAEEPRAGQIPFAVNGAHRDTKRGGGFVRGEAAEETQFHQLAFAVVDLLQGGQGLVERQQIRASIRRSSGFAERNQNRPAAALLSAPGDGLIHEHPPRCAVSAHRGCPGRTDGLRPVVSGRECSE